MSNTIHKYFTMPASGISTRSTNPKTPKAIPVQKNNQIKPQLHLENLRPTPRPLNLPTNGSLLEHSSVTQKTKFKKTVKVEDIRGIIKEVTEEPFKNYREKINKKINNQLENLKTENKHLKSDLTNLKRENQALKRETRKTNNI